MSEIVGQTVFGKGDGGVTFRRAAAVVMLAASFVLWGCSAQPVSRHTELEMAAAGAVIGAGGGALVSTASSHYSMVQTSVIGAASLAGVVILYEEVKREAAHYGPYQDVSGSEDEGASGAGAATGSFSGAGSAGNATGSAAAAGLKLN